MELRRLRYFLAMAEELHLGRAAERAHIEESPLSRSLTQLEASLGVQLFFRSRHGTRLTPAGEALKEHATQLLIDFERAKRAVRLAGGVQLTLRVGIADGLAQPRLSALFAQWRETEPSIPLQVSELHSSHLQEALVTEHLDVGFSFGIGSPRGVSAEPSWQEPVVVVVPSGHPLATRRTLRVAEVIRHPLVMCSRRFKPGFSEQIDALVKRYGERVRVIDRADTLAGVIVKVGSGYGLGFADAAHASTLQRPDVAMVPLANGGARITTFALTKLDRDDDLSPAIQRFVGMARMV
ncbi:LysR family transcriptional regulator [Cupriavidus basilensis]|uniref:LysR family transcriptional regulator n=1 Tax=Cupriavidus basilensis TaxID=68895 RepID=A0ABT6AH90_9BURK|nr:LysR family transcriptional regulator [Cupriavidus basilensis]MDF3831964.1 LysR family transcriptional regulator [Cupriavidus basilensis]